MEAPASRVTQCLLAAPTGVRQLSQRPRAAPAAGSRRLGGAVLCVVAPDKHSQPQPRKKLDWSNSGTKEAIGEGAVLEGSKASRARSKLTREEAKQEVRAERDAQWASDVDGVKMRNSGALSAGVQWYSIWTAKGYEDRVADLLQQDMAKLPPLRSKDGSLKPRFYTVWAPKKKIMVATARGTIARTVRYGMENTGEWVLLECIMDNDVFQLVNSIPSVRGFRHKHPQADWVPLPCSDELVLEIQDWLWDPEDKDESSKQPEGRDLGDVEEKNDEDVASVPLDVMEDIEKAFGHGGKNIDTWEKPRSKSRQRRGRSGRGRSGRGRAGKGGGMGRTGRNRSHNRQEDRGSQDEVRRETVTWYEGPGEPADPWSQWQEDLQEPTSINARQEQEEEVNRDDGWMGPALSDPGNPSSQWFEDEVSNTEDGAVGWMEATRQAADDVQRKSSLTEANAFEALNSALTGLEEDLDEQGASEIHAIEGTNTPQNQNEREDASGATHVAEHEMEPAQVSGDDDWALYGDWRSEASAAEEQPSPVQSTVDSTTMDSPGREDASVVSSEQAAARDDGGVGTNKKKRGRPRKSLVKPSTASSGTSFSEGDSVLVVSGTFEEFKGTVIKVGRKTVDVNLDIFGRTTTVAIDKQCLKKTS